MRIHLYFSLRDFQIKKMPNVVGASRSLNAYSGQDARTTIRQFISWKTLQLFTINP
jgi:hypothetical protein